MTYNLAAWRQAAHMAAQHGATEARYLEIYGPALDQMTEEDFKRAVIDDPTLDITPDFLGFAKTYAHALDILPSHPGIDTVVDLGCSKGFQAYAFRDAGFAYVGVDLTLNTIESHASIEMYPSTNIIDFCNNLPAHINPRTTVAIMSAVPGTDELMPYVRADCRSTVNRKAKQCAPDAVTHREHIS
ncbi:hypothetical protein [Adlercreutzia muris]|uniref:hypothetical protein n=1 Tax=Adlercreutzia muris TaxID=1796610 RepID=UPI001F56D22C|nr:hypothetical protein [Adlercreutzia muris]